MNRWQQLLRPVLIPFAALYGVGNFLRNKMYDAGWLKSARFHHPIISIGNLSVGGTGKSPHLEYLLSFLLPSFDVATLSRGYGRKTSGLREVIPGNNAEEVGDEPLQFKRKFPYAHVFVGENRMLAIPDILNHYPNNQVILLDDAFQHRAVKAGLSILLTEYNAPFTEDYLLPAGRLREPRSGYERADLIVVTKCPETLNDKDRERLEKAIQPKSYQHLYFSTYVYGMPYHILNASQTFSLADKKEILLLSGIADPSLMEEKLKAMGHTVYLHQFADHHYFDRYDLESVKAAYDSLSPEKRILLTTEKDAVRLLLHRDWIEAQQLPVYCLPIRVKFTGNDGPLFERDIIHFLTVTLQQKSKIQDGAI